MTAANPRLDATLAIAARGGHVLPIWNVADRRCACGDLLCSSPGKHPLGALVPQGLRDATTDADVIREWWDRRPDANLAAVMAPSGWIALDVDFYHGDGDKLRALKAKHGELPRTVTQVSGSGQGEHLIFRSPPFRPRGVIGGIVVRSSAYIVLAPSNHISGGVYRWEPGCSPGEIGVAELPAKWIEALRRDVAAVGTAGVPAAEPKWLAEIPQPTRVLKMIAHLDGEPGEQMGVNRAGMTFDVARTCARGFAIHDPQAVLDALREIYNPRCQPPWDDGRLARKVSEAYMSATTPVWGDSLLIERLLSRGLRGAK